MAIQTPSNTNDPNLFLNVSAIGNFNDKTSDTSGYGELPAVEQNQTYFAYFDGAGRQDPELPRQTTFFIKYLIDTEGNTTKPQPNTPSIINLTNNFETGKPVIITTRTPTLALKPLLGEKTVTHVGELSTLLITNTGSGKNDYVQSIYFNDAFGSISNNVALNYNGSFIWRDPSTNIDNIPFTVTYVQIPDYCAMLNTNKVAVNSFHPPSTLNGRWAMRFDPLSPNLSAAEWIYNSPNTAYYRFDTSTNDGFSRVKFSLKTIMRVLDVTVIDDGIDYGLTYNTSGVEGITNITVTFTIEKESGTGNYENIGIYSITINNTYDAEVNFETGYFNFEVGDKVRVFVQPSSFLRETLPNGNVRIRAAAFYKSPCLFSAFNENQNIGAIINGVNGATPPYFEIGEYPDQNENSNAPSISTSVLTASSGLYNMYRPGLIQSASTPIQNYFYMKPWQEWYQLIPGDKIIFENNKNNVHTITEILPNVSSSDGSSSFGLRVVPGIPTGSIVSNFCIYRILDNGAQIMIDQEKPTGTADLEFKGFIKPKYISQELESKFIDIVNKLEADGLLT